MIVHRDYRSASDSVVKIFSNKIEFYNPGRLPENITVEDLLSNNYISTPRNKLIADFCKNLGLIEKYGSPQFRDIRKLSTPGDFGKTVAWMLPSTKIELNYTSIRGMGQYLSIIYRDNTIRKKTLDKL